MLRTNASLSAPSSASILAPVFLPVSVSFFYPSKGFPSKDISWPFLSIACFEMGGVRLEGKIKWPVFGGWQEVDVIPFLKRTGEDVGN